MTGLINFNTTMMLSTTSTGCRLCLYNIDSLNNWYGFGMNASQLIYNTPSGACHIFQVNGSTIVSINSSGLNIGSNLLSSTIHRMFKHN